MTATNVAGDVRLARACLLRVAERPASSLSEPDDPTADDVTATTVVGDVRLAEAHLVRVAEPPAPTAGDVTAALEFRDRRST